MGKDNTLFAKADGQVEYTTKGGDKKFVHIRPVS
jgi:ribosomal protein L27